MNRSIVRFLISKLLLIEAGLLVVPLIVLLFIKKTPRYLPAFWGLWRSSFYRSAWYSL